MTLGAYRLTREGLRWVVVAVLVAVAGWMKTINLLLLLGYTMLAMLAVNAWFARRIARRATAKRVQLPAGFAGQTLVRQFDVANSASSPVAVTIEENSPAHAALVFVPSLGPGESRRVTAEYSHPQRGLFPVSPVSAVAGYPFGLIKYARPLTGEDSLVVLPALGQVDIGMLRRWLIRTGAGDATARKPVGRHTSHHADVRGVRAYRPGDSPRDVHWRTTARRGQLMVREYDNTEPLDLVLVVEPYLPDNPSAADFDRLEASFSLAASIVWAWCLSDEGPTVTVAVAGKQGTVVSGKGVEGFARQSLVHLAKASGGANAGELPPGDLRRPAGRSARVLVSPRSPSPLMNLLRGRCGVPFVAADPQQSWAWYTPPIVPARA
jgi:uncharacterized protein (DUF58 family)